MAQVPETVEFRFKVLEMLFSAFNDSQNLTKVFLSLTIENLQNFNNEGTVSSSISNPHFPASLDPGPKL